MTLLGGGVAAWPLAARGQQPAKLPRVGILSPAASETAATMTAFREEIRDLGYIEGQTIALDFRLSKGIMEALPALAAELVRIPVNVIVTDSTSLSKARVPAVYPEREYADDGGLIAYGPNVPAHFRLAASYVDHILRGTNPGDLPINATSQFDFVVNLRTAHAHGLALPPDFVSAANEVIE
jgi:putative tryptophan/tyrosine transport system substrate-binding protein